MLPHVTIWENDGGGGDNKNDHCDYQHAAKHKNKASLNPGFAGRKWVVEKFGGTSVANAECFVKVAEILEDVLGCLNVSDGGVGEESSDSSSSTASHDDIADGLDLSSRSTNSSSSRGGGEGGGGGGSGSGMSSQFHNNHNHNHHHRDSSSFFKTKVPKKNLVAVVSAIGGKPKTTDLLLDAVRYASERDTTNMESCLEKVLEKHDECITKLFGRGSGNEREDDEDRSEDSDIVSTLMDVVHNDLDDIRDILKTVSLMKWNAERISEVVSGYGELWSTRILAALLSKRSEERRGRVLINSAADDDNNGDSCNNNNPRQPWHHEFVYLDARRVITIDEEVIQGGAVVWDVSESKFAHVFEEESKKLCEKWNNQKNSSIRTDDGNDAVQINL